MNETKFDAKLAFKNIYINIFFWSFWIFVLFFLLCILIPTNYEDGGGMRGSPLFAIDITHVVLLILSIVFLVFSIVFCVIFKNKMKSNDKWYLIFIICSVSTITFFVGFILSIIFLLMNLGNSNKLMGGLLYLIISLAFFISAIIIAYLVRQRVTYSFYPFWMIIFVLGCVICAIYGLGVPVLILFLPKKYPLNSAVHQHKENLKNNKAELQKWEKLHKDGVITDEEFKMQKAALE